MISNQEFFNKVKKHLLTQGVQSGTGNTCLYRDRRGFKCAIGGALPDEILDFIDQNNLNSDNVDTISTREVIRPFLPDSISLAMRLQRVHDVVLPCKWESNLSEVAKEFSLTN
jgi:hypothetical protein